MGCIVAILGVIALVATYGTGLFPFAIATAVVLFWSNGVIANYRPNPRDAPNWAAVASAVASLATVGLLIAGVVLRLAGGSLSWQDADSHVGDTREVCGPLQSMVEDSGDTFLNIGKDYPDDLHPSRGSEGPRLG